MVLNLLQKHSLDEVKDLLERSFAEYLAQKKLVPEQQAIADLTAQLAKLDVELATFDTGQFASYEKLRERLKEELRLLEILLQQAEAAQKREIAPRLSQLQPGTILFLKGKHVPVTSPLTAVFVSYTPGSGQASDLVCIGADNRWYVVTNNDVTEIYSQSLPVQTVESLLPTADNLRLGRWRKGNEVTAALGEQLTHYSPLPSAPEVIEQQQRVNQVLAQLEQHPLQQQKILANCLSAISSA